MMANIQKVYVLDDAGDVWPLAADLATDPAGAAALVELEGRQIQAAKLIDCWRWMFGDSSAR